jgi:hypothetical protein
VQQRYGRERRHTSNVGPQPAGYPFETELKHKRILPTLCAEVSSELPYAIEPWSGWLYAQLQRRWRAAHPQVDRPIT